MKLEFTPLLLEWSDFLSVGDEELDRQHREIVDCINDLYVARFENDLEQIRPILKVLAEHAALHFKHEETLMSESSYPEIDDHRKEHRYLEVSVSKYMDRFNAGENISGELQEFLFWWLVHHIRNFDIKTQKYIRENT